jgi:hypothetical protein
MKRANNFSPFAKANSAVQAPAPSVVETDEAMFGETRKAEKQRGASKLVSIFDIQPDITQPRRAIPANLRDIPIASTFKPTYANSDLFEYWVYEVGAERALLLNIDLNQPFAIGEYSASYAFQYDVYFGGGDERDIDDELAEPGPTENALLDIVNLAISIQRDGLINPIGVARWGDKYIIETGERRWLAYHLLYAYTRDERWSHIPTRVMDSFDRFRQATENTQRGDLNAVARARQYALLLMELWQQRGETFQPYEAFETDRAFYAQVADKPAPDGLNELLLNACGIKSKSMAARYRKVLRLTDQEWAIAEREGFSFDVIEGRFTVVNPPLVKQEKSTKKKPSQKRGFEATKQAFESGFTKHIKSLDKTAARKAIAEQREWLNTLEAKIDG